VLQHRHHAVRKEAHVGLGLVMRDAAEREFGHQMVGPSHPPKFGDLLQAILGVPTIWILT
jgi:hypothetical protein